MKNDFKKILGIDLGIASIGWALIEADDKTPQKIIDMGVRIIPLTADDEKEFSQGNAITKNQKRTEKRTQRKGLDRYQLRRKALLRLLEEKKMMPNKYLLLELSPLEIWGLRDKALHSKLSLQELGRVWLHLNQRRGYQHSKIDVTDSKQTEYVQTVNARYDYIKSNNQTIGQYFYAELKKYFATEQKITAAFRVKEEVFPRAAYIEEFDKIWEVQQKYHPDLLTDELFEQVRNEIIYYQRKLKSQKGLVNVCEFEGKYYTDKSNPEKQVFSGPKVAPKSSPLFQIEKIWESINNIVVKNRKGEEFPITQEHRQQIFEHLDNNEKLSQTDLFAILGLKKNDGYFTNAMIRRKGLQGNLTKTALAAILGKDHPMLAMSLETMNYEFIDVNTGEVVKRIAISPEVEKAPFYKLWHCIYSLNENDCIKTLVNKLSIEETIARKLTNIDFTKAGFGNKSAKAIRKLLPYLQQGLTYDKAGEKVGYNHSNSITKAENADRKLEKALQLLPKNSLRQPIVEKILNQLINITNALLAEYGEIDEIRIELARELQQSKEERNKAYKAINRRERENKDIVKLLLEHSEFKKKAPSKRDVERYRLWEEFNKVSPYEPHKIISFSEIYNGTYDIEHIIPRSLRFDDSFGNKTLCPRKYNSGESGKNTMTAYDFMSRKRSNEDFESFIACIEQAYSDGRISKTKYENLLRRQEEIREDFISRNINDTRYITRKSKEILTPVCRNIFVTSGIITQRLRSLWGWDEILEYLNLPKYKELGMTFREIYIHNEQEHEREKIEGWTKRDDHRHHAIDALAVACTRQGFIQRINTLNAKHTRDEMFDETKNTQYSEKLNLLDKYLLQYKPFETADILKATADINISFKPGKKTATFSRRLIKAGGKKQLAQSKIIEPRGPLSEESVYGKITRKSSRKVKLNAAFDSNLCKQIIDDNIRQIIGKRLLEFENNPEKAFSNLKKNPIWLDDQKQESITQVEIRDIINEFVIKYPLENITIKDVPFIVDPVVKSKVLERLKQFGEDHKTAWKNLAENPLWQNEQKKIPIKRIRLFTGIDSSSVVPIKVIDESWGIEYEKYVKPGNNHHIAVYKDKDGKLQEHVVTFWHVVERKKYGFPVIIKEPEKIWSEIFEKDRELPQNFLDNLPLEGWEFCYSMQQNESFIFNMQKEDVITAIESKDYNMLSKNIFRVRKLSSGAYWFNQQYETSPRESLQDKKANRCVQASLNSMSGIKVKITLLGEIILSE